MITIFVPTANRPVFLKAALESVALQSRRDLISSVLVSENGGCKESRLVAESFMDVLPIQWIWQDGLPIRKHVMNVLPLFHSRYVTMLADDDMLGRYHLEEALRCFETHPDIVAYFGQAVCTDSQACQVSSRFSGTFDQVLDQLNQPLQDFFVWDQVTTAINSVAATPLNIWACVAKKEAHEKALIESSGDPVFGQYAASDCLYIWRLACAGPIAYGRNVSFFYRVHDNSDMRMRSRAAYHEVKASTMAIRKEIVRQCAEMGIDAIGEWRKAYNRAQKQGIAHLISVESTETLEWLLYDGSKLPKGILAAKAKAKIKEATLSIIPPIIARSVKATLDAIRR